MSKNKNYHDIEKFEDGLVLNEYDYHCDADSIITEIEKPKKNKKLTEEPLEITETLLKEVLSSMQDSFKNG
jgi:acetoacetate decarboxylase